MYNIIAYAEIHEEFNKTNRVWIAHTEQEIGVIIQTHVFCVDETCFPRPSHIFINDAWCLYLRPYPTDGNLLSVNPVQCSYT